MGIIGSTLSFVWENFFWYTQAIYSTEFVMRATVVLTILLLLYRIFGPEEQGGSFGQSQTMEVEPGPAQVSFYGPFLLSLPSPSCVAN